MKYDLQARLRSCNFQINEEKEGIITNIAERYVKAMISNIDEKFSQIFETFLMLTLCLIWKKFLLITHPMNLL